MTIYIKSLGGTIKNGQVTGAAEIYTETFNSTGDGEVYKGNFVKNKLNDSTGEKIIYNNTSFIYYVGSFINNLADGTMTIYSWENASPETDEEKQISGDGVCTCYGRRHLYNSINSTVLVGRKKTIIYSQGIEGATLTDDPINMTINVSQMLFKTYKIINNFVISEA
jgi:hypothetical protein